MNTSFIRSPILKCRSSKRPLQITWQPKEPFVLCQGSKHYFQYAENMYITAIRIYSNSFVAYNLHLNQTSFKEIGIAISLTSKANSNFLL